MHSPPELTFYLKQKSVTNALPDQGSLTVGRGAGVHLRVDDTSVSREHLLIHIGPDSLHVEDLGSFNGTQLCRSERGGEAVKLRPKERYELRKGDVLRLGNVSALLQYPGSIPVLDGVTSPPPSTRGRVLVDRHMKQVYELAERAAISEISVLILGETGAGKELLAAHVHEKSPRSQMAFCQLNCAALAETLLESELFGHEKGAFTGAHARRAGLLESAQGGTVFLDEIGEMPLSTQAKLLRVLEDRKIRRLGSTQALAINVRFVAATNRNLQLEVAAGRFREDLYYRIMGIALQVPALRDRPIEIEPLARHFLHDFCLKNCIAAPELTQSALFALHDYDWPGNVRELKNVMERAPFISGGAPLTADHFPSQQSPAPLDSDDFLDEEHTDITVNPGFGTPSLTRTSEVEIARQRGRTATSPTRSGQPPNAFRMPAPPSASGLMGESVEPGFRQSALLARQKPNSEQSPAPSQADSLAPDISAESGRLTHRNSKNFSSDLEKKSVMQALESCSGNQTRAAAMLGVSRRTLISRIEAFGLPRPRKRG